MSEKVGILTFHRALSYGALLQAYALQTKLFSLDIDNEIVDYTCDYMVKHYQRLFRPMKGNPAKVFVLNLLTANGIWKERKTRDRFVAKHMKLSPAYNAENIAQAAQQYSAFVTGSDQVWSPSCVGFDPVYFLGFAAPEQRYSYAASIATQQLPQALHDEYRKRLKDFALLSLREQSGVELVQQVVGRNDAQVHIDPTFLLKKAEWDQIVPECIIKKPYIFLFTVKKPKQLIEQALALSRKTSLPIFYLNKQHTRREKEIHYMDPVEADQFISLIKNASYVCTNSFHGLAFSIIYHKQFMVENALAKGRNIRSEELLNRLGLSNRVFAEDNGAIDEQPDWTATDALIEAERRRAEAYLLQIKQQLQQRRKAECPAEVQNDN